MADQPQSANDNEQSAIKRYLPLALLVGAIILVFSMGWHRYLTLETLADNRDLLKTYVAENFFLAALLFAALYISATALSLPGGLLLSVTSGFIFGSIIGGTIVVFAASIGASIIFLIAKTALGDQLASRAGPFLDRLRDGFQENALNYMLFLRLVPVFPFWLVNLAPAFLGVPLRTFFIGTLIGIIPGTFAFAFAGAGLDSIIAAQRASYEACLASNPADQCSFSLDPSALITTELLIAFAALGVMALVPVIVQRIRGKSNSD